MNPIEVDHLIVAAHTLEAGAAWCELTLGVSPGPGGRHALMGTHNRLLNIGTAAFPRAYLEIIAVDPGAPPPGRARWFGLDDPTLRASLRDDGPRLIHFVARTSNLDGHRSVLRRLGFRPGEPLRASRDTPQGLLSWQILVRSDGTLDQGGALPTLIQWGDRHPADTMAASGVTLQSLTLDGLGADVAGLLRLPGVDIRHGGPPSLRATLSTPHGDVTLESR